MPSLKLFLLGPLRLERDGMPVKLDTRKNVALVAYLAVTGESHSREALITLLWPELEPSRARANLRRNLSVLKKALNREWLVVDRESVGTDPDADFWLDVDQFRALLTTPQEHTHPEGNACPTCLDALAEAVELYRGDFMAGFGLRDSAAFDEWQFFKTEGLRQELAAALERLVRAYSRLGRFGKAIPHARRWVTLDPLHEPAQRWLMQLYAQTGQRAAALRQYQECVRILQAEVGLAPSEETTSLYEQVQTGEVGGEESPAPTALPRHNLPVQSTRFIGRAQSLVEIRERFRNPDCRLLTLVGPGGCGKTRLALEAAATLLDDFQHGVFFVSLAPLQSARAIVPTVARAIGLSFYGTAGGEREVEPRQQLLDYLRHKQMLLILDNFEHLLACPEHSRGNGVGLVADVLSAASGVKVLATSRARLNLQGEHLYAVAGMSLPDSAVELFVASARRVQPDFGLTTSNLADVTHICRLVEGMPLGILLAAAWVQMLSLAEIATQISQSIDFLATNLRDLPERQRSMRAVFDHSWNLLTPRLRTVMEALSVFRGSFSWSAARQVTGASLQELRTLVEKSLLHQVLTDRFEMHELLRQYAAEKLGQNPTAGQAVRDQHCAYYTSALQRWATDLKGPRQQQALAEMDVELENARVAWDWAVTQGQVGRLKQAMEGLGLFYTRRGRYEEGEAACRTAAEALQAAASHDGLSVRIRALGWQSAFAQELGHIELADRLLQRCQDLVGKLTLSRQDAQAERAFVLRRMGEVAYSSDLKTARRLFEQSLALYRASGDRWETAYVLRALGSVALNAGDYGRSKQLYEESLAIRRALGDQGGIANSLQGLGRVSLSLGEVEEGERLVREGIAISEEIGDQAGIVKGLNNLSVLLPWSGRFAEAEALLKKSAAICNDLGLQTALVFANADLSTMKGHLGEYESACSLAKSNLALAREINHSWGVGHALLILGIIASIEKAHDRAWQFLQESLSVYREAGERDMMGFVLAFSGVVALQLEQISLARQCFCEALRMLSITRTFEPSVGAVATAALFLAEQGQSERAVELYATVSRYPLVSSSRLYRDGIGQHIAAVAATLRPEVVAAAQERGRAQNLDATVAELLVELGE
jgi:predicted ATPase/DNA-binding SARP family transcriptional activator